MVVGKGASKLNTGAFKLVYRQVLGHAQAMTPPGGLALRRAHSHDGSLLSKKLWRDYKSSQDEDNKNSNRHRASDVWMRCRSLLAILHQHPTQKQATIRMIATS
jgi:hypothetical protein